MDEIITYESLYEILRKDKYNQELQALDKDFFKKTLKYLKEKEAILESQRAKSSVFAQKEVEKTAKQLANIRKIITEIYELRENKIIQLAIFASRGGISKNPNLLKEEQSLFDSTLKTLKIHREGILINLLSKKEPAIEKPKDLKKEEGERGSSLIRFIHTVPKFVGTDLQVYGPFEPEDIASLPDKVSDLLIKKGRAEEIK